MSLNPKINMQKSLVAVDLKVPLTAICKMQSEFVELRVPHRIEVKRAYMLTTESGKQVFIAICPIHKEESVIEGLTNSP